MQEDQPNILIDVSCQQSIVPEFSKLQKKTISSLRSSIEMCNSVSIDLDTDKNEIQQQNKNQESKNNLETIEPGLDQANINESIYKRFQLKVLAIFFINWSIVCLFMIIVATSESLQEFLNKSNYLFYFFLAIIVVIFMILYCYHNVAKRVPYNYLLLFGFTLGISYVMGYCCAEVSKVSLLLISGLITFWIIALFIYAFKSKTDITYKVSAFGYGSIAIFVILLSCVAYRDQILEIIIGLLIAGVFSFLLVYDIQKLRGQFQKKYEIDDYIIAALNIYIEVIVIFKTLIATISDN